ncbi:hypothetical protein [Shewanella algae]|uniref:hypothetical protein n=1 Tax=Shewanella algae TaxID=38313 RepID=UPI0011442BCB|nr:hypothetical protein [Shewanella algae]MBO2650066.1 hypothetical protein [Shewanella algae]MBO2671211.1 hypothetical protein [Shewanella algae]
MNIKSTVKATLIAPWASLLVVVFAFGCCLLGMEPDHFQQMVSQIPRLLFVLAMFVFGFVGTSYLLVLVCGVPVHMVLSKLKITHWSIYIVLGVSIGLLYQYSQLTGSSMPSQLQETGYISYAVSSFLVALAFWYIAVKPHNKARQNRPAGWTR